MPQDVLEVTKRFMREPIRILVRKEELTLEGIRQFYISVEREVRQKCSVYLISLNLLRLTSNVIAYNLFCMTLDPETLPFNIELVLYTIPDYLNRSIEKLVIMFL